MKTRILAAIMAVAGFLAWTASAQYLGQPGLVLSSGTNTVAATTTNTTAFGAAGATTTNAPIAHVYVPGVAGVPMKDVCFGIQFRLAGSGTSNVRFDWYGAVNGGNTNLMLWETTPRYSIPIAANGTTLVTVTTNITINGVSDLFLVNLGNANATAVTNLVVTYNPK